MAEPFLGEIKPVGFNFAPRGWALCQGQILPISQNTALFSLLGTNYGGNGQTTFALPNLQSNVAISSGQGPGLADYSLGEVGGETSIQLTLPELPSHVHNLTASSAAATNQVPTGRFPAKSTKTLYSTTTNGSLNPDSVIADGGAQTHNNFQPYLGINYIIALEGIFPARN